MRFRAEWGRTVAFEPPAQAFQTVLLHVEWLVARCGHEVFDEFGEFVPAHFGEKTGMGAVRVGMPAI